MEDEHILIERLKAKDEAAFTELVERYYGYLLPLADFFVSNSAVAEEVVQEAWLAVLNGIDRFEGDHIVAAKFPDRSRHERFQLFPPCDLARQLARDALVG